MLDYSILLTTIFMKWVCAFADEFKGHCLLEAARQADPAKVKKYLVPDVVNFKHPYTGDTPLVSIELKQ